MGDWKKRMRKRSYFSCMVSSVSVCVLLAVLTLARLAEGTFSSVSERVFSLGPFLFLFFAGAAALNFHRWKHSEEDR